MLSTRSKRFLVTSAALSAVAWVGFAFLFSQFTSGAPRSSIALAAVLSFLLFVGAGTLALGVTPLLIGRFMASSNSALDLVNKVALVVALASVVMGVLFALATIYGTSSFTKHLLTCVVLFVGAACVLCTLKFFYTNRANE